MLWWFISAWIASGAVVPISWLLSVVRHGVFLGDTEAEQTREVVESHSAATAASTAQSAYGIRWLAWSLATWACRLLERSPGSTQRTPVAHHPGRYALSGLVSIGALILLYVGSFGASNRPSSSTVAHAPATQAVEADVEPIQPLASANLSPSPAQLSATPTQGVTNGEVGQAQRDLSSLGEAEQVAAQPQPGDARGSAGDDASGRTEAAAPQVPAAGALLIIYPRIPGAERGAGHSRARGPLIRPYVAPANRGTWLFPPTTNAGSNS
jgi:hypothetical protein